jgi:CHASE2 domain-containing sensor protein
MSDNLNPIWVFVSAFGVSAFAGLAALLRAGKSINGIAIFSAIFNSGLLGLALALLWYHKFQDNIYFLIGICVLAGLGGATMVDFVLQMFKAGGLSISVGKKEKSDGIE